jgi:hypothetical protein
MSSPALALPLAVERVRVREALGWALRDFYEHSWRLALLNSAFSLAALTLAAAAAFSLLALALAPLLGAFAAALAHCCVTLAQTGELRLACAARGLRLHWRRGIELGLLAAIVVAAGVFAIVFYASAESATWPLAFAVAYLLATFGILQLHLWPIAVAEPALGLQSVLVRAVTACLLRPGATIGLAAVLLVVNLAGIGAAVMPFLTLTVAYSFLAAAHFALPRSPLREV